MSKLMQHTGNFINEKCDKCGNYLIQNPWGQKWCMRVKVCGWFDDTITTDYPMPKEIQEVKEVEPKKIYRLIIAGGRDFDDFDLLEKEVKKFLKGKRPSEIEIVSGAASGADTLGEDFAKKYKTKLYRKKAEWKKYGNAAGQIRNQKMGIYASQGEVRGGCICFWDGESKGTKGMIGYAKKYGLELKVVSYPKKGE